MSPRRAEEDEIAARRGGGAAPPERVDAPECGRPASIRPAVCWRLALVLAGLTACTPIEASLDDAPAADRGVGPDASSACIDDRFGPSGAGAPAAALGVGEYAALVACADAPDWFALEHPPDRAVIVEIRAESDVTGRLWRLGSGPAQQIDVAHGSLLVLRGQGEGLVLEVAGVNVGYALALRAAPIEQVCPSDTGSVAAGGVVERALCADGPDRVELALAAGQPALVHLEPGASSAVRVTLWWPVGAPPTRWVRADELAIEPGRAARFAVAGPAVGALQLSAVADEPSVGDRWTVRVDTSEAPAWAPCTIDASLGAWSRAVDAQGLGEPEPRPAAGARIDALAVGGDGDLAGDLTALSGLGWLDHVGRGSFVGFIPPEGALELRLVTAVDSETGRDAEAPGPTPIPVRVGPDGEVPWAEVVAEVTADACAGGAVALEAALDAAGPTAAAWAIARSAADGLDRLGPLLPEAPAPPVRYRWSPGFAADCGACFRPGERPLIELSGRVSDPDQWDASVVLHELGHYIAAVFSRDDSGGGPHDGSPIEPAIAWSEGFATFFAGWSLGTAMLFDYRVVGVRVTDLEEMDDPRAFGTADGSLTGAVSEHLVAAVLWDYHDRPAADDDPEALDDAVLFGPLFGPLAGPWRDRGAPGVDLVDYLDALWCAEGPLISTAPVAERGFPLDEPTTCRAKIDGRPGEERARPSLDRRRRSGAWELSRR